MKILHILFSNHTYTKEKFKCQFYKVSNAKDQNFLCRLLKFGFSEKATKCEKNLRCTFDKSVVFCARNSVLVKKSTKIFFENVDKSYYTKFNLNIKFIQLIKYERAPNLIQLSQNLTSDCLLI